MRKPRVINIDEKVTEKKVTIGDSKTSKLDIRSSSEQKSTPLTADDLAAAVSRIVHRGYIRESYHSHTERSERNISDDDVQFGLTANWTLAEKPNWDEKHQNWEYLIRTRDIEGDELFLKIAVEVEHDRVRIITKF